MKINKTEFTGVAGKDAVVSKQTSSGSVKVYWSIAINNDYKKAGSSEYTKETVWMDCYRWFNDPDEADVFCNRILKGKEYYVTGSLRDSSYTDNSGVRITKTSLQCLTCVLVQTLNQPKAEHSGSDNQNNSRGNSNKSYQDRNSNSGGNQRDASGSESYNDDQDNIPF